MSGMWKKSDARPAQGGIISGGLRGLSSRLQRSGAWLTPAGLALAAGFLAALWLGLLLAEIGHFSAGIALLAGSAAGGLAWRHFRRRGGDSPALRPLSPGLLAVGLLALVSLAWRLPPSEVILGGWDPGVYLHTAALLVEEGSLRPLLPDLAALDADSRALIGRQGQDAWEPFLGMRLLPDGHISPQFHHLYPVLMALLWPFGGVRAALMVNPLLHAVCIVGLYLWACRWVRPRWAFAAALGLALNPAQVWQAGFSTSELLTQCLLLIGLLATDRALSGGAKDRVDAIMAGGAFGLMLLARYDAILFVVPFALLLLVGLRDRSRRGQVVTLLGTIAVLGVQMWAHHRYLAPLYHPMANVLVPGLWAAGALGLVIAAAAILMPRGDGAPVGSMPGRRVGLRMAVVAGLIVWIILYGYVRPRLTVEGRVLGLATWLYPHLKEAGWFALAAGRNARNFWYLQSLFGAVGLTLAFAGVAVLIFRARRFWQTAWLLASLLVLALLMTQISHEPFMMFVSRRLVPVVLPLMCLGVAALCDRLEWALRAYPRRAGAVVWLLLGVSLAGPLGGTLFMARHREWPGLLQWCDQVAETVPRGALVYSDATGFAAPLRFLYGIQACEVRSLSPGQPTDPMGMLLALAGDHAVFWLSETVVPGAYASHAAPTARFPLRSVILGSDSHRVPRHLRARNADFTLYRIRADAGGSVVLTERIAN